MEHSLRENLVITTIIKSSKSESGVTIPIVPVVDHSKGFHCEKQQNRRDERRVNSISHLYQQVVQWPCG